MEIIIRNNNRILIKENSKEININDGDIIQYNGIYYKNINHIVRTVNIETTFIGIVENCMSRYDTGIVGIYIDPLYILYDDSNAPGERKWHKIINYKLPTNKYFYYPHLLMLPDLYYHFRPLYFLHTCKNSSLSDFNNITKEFSLGNTPYY
jgi:hypothetical protein